jgi:hypothetical protein
MATGSLLFFVEPIGIFLTWARGYSAVNMLDPEYLHEESYKTKMGELESMMGAGTTDNVDVPPEVMLFLCRLCGAVYEGNKRHDLLMEEWGLKEPSPAEDDKHMMEAWGLQAAAPTPGRFNERVLHENFTATIIGHDDILLVVFKGTSPANLNEWLCDLSITKTRATKQAFALGCTSIEGEVHDGFYRAFLPVDGQAEWSPLAEIVYHCIVYATERKEGQGKLWVTGHSLVVALASMFVLLIASARETRPEDLASLLLTPEDGANKWQHLLRVVYRSKHRLKQVANGLRYLRGTLAGVCTFGTPLVADHHAAAKVPKYPAKKHVRYACVRNGNEVVSTVPLQLPLVSLLAKFFRTERPTGAIRSAGLALDYAPVFNSETRIGHLGEVQKYQPLTSRDPIVRAGQQLGNGILLTATMLATVPRPSRSSRWRSLRRPAIS